MSIIISKRERFADKIFITLNLFSKTLFIFTGILGLYYYKILGFFIGLFFGYLLGLYILWSTGYRHSDQAVGFYIRMRERAKGKKRSFIEYCLEKIRGNEFSIEKCKKIVEIYESEISKLQKLSNLRGYNKIPFELYKKIKEISYSK